MRPIKLTMTGFGPYAKETTVDFEKLGEKGLYLITGDTGAGKTTIFDAITYALFGKASGDNRAEDMLRSKYADIGTPTEVTLVFEYAGKRYTVKRSPEYERPKKRGEGTTTEKAKAELIYPDGRPSPKEVTAAVQEILGLDRSQFSQIAMIAQGDFLKLLLAETKDRQIIFRKIFKTELFEQLQKHLSDEAKEVSSDCEQLKNNINKDLARTRCREDSSLYGEWEHLQQLVKTMQAEETLSILGQIITEDQQNYETNQQTRKQLAEQNDHVTEELTKAEELEKEAAALRQAQQEHAQLISELRKCEEQLGQAKEKCSLCDGRVNQLSEKISQAVKPDKEKLLARQKALQEQIQALNNEQESISARLEANRGAAQSIDRQIRELEALQHKLSWLQALSDTANGTASGKAKIMLETYVQMNYFDSIIRKANVRLMTMSGGQYELERRREADNKQSKFGLELDVIDHYNGSRRDVRTLSGGESFKAALSLALGLADVIQSSAGGIRLDTLFVDEGFGNLDEVSLKQALKALRNLAEETRLVGIISHVTDLKQNIDKQIEVTKDRDCGSRVEVIV